MPPTESIGGIGGGVFFQIRGQKTRFDKKKRFKILLEIDQIYGDGRGFQNLACLRTKGGREFFLCLCHDNKAIGITDKLISCLLKLLVNDVTNKVGK